MLSDLAHQLEIRVRTVVVPPVLRGEAHIARRAPTQRAWPSSHGERLAQSRRYDALVALGAVIRGDTYHFEIVANESAAGVANVQLETGVPIGNGILTCGTEEQARARMDAKGYEAAQAALELANLMSALEER